MLRTFTASVFVIVAMLRPLPAAAQQFPFERAFAASEASILDVTTARGRITVTAADTDRLVIRGVATVRLGADLPSNGIEKAKRLAADPPIERSGNVVTIGLPADAADRRAVTLSYEIHVPRTTEIRANTESGATSVRGVSGTVSVRTHSAAIDLDEIGGAVSAFTGSGAVTASRITGPLTITTASSAVNGRDLGGAVRVRTQSGAVDAAFTRAADADVQTGSGAIRLLGVAGAVTTRSESGRVALQGSPRAPWSVSTGSGNVRVQLTDPAPFSLAARSRSGSVAVEGTAVDGVVGKREATGHVSGGGPAINLTSRSGSIRVQRLP